MKPIHIFIDGGRDPDIGLFCELIATNKNRMQSDKATLIPGHIDFKRVEEIKELSQDKTRFHYNGKQYLDELIQMLTGEKA